ncbi:MAG: HK97 gp10 family phage protein [Eubacteriales bacterium]|nr:HK97 gp10 family phage protein [Eubacteriales bacterium]
MIRNLETVCSNMDRVAKVDVASVAADTIKFVQGQAKMHCPVDHGELRDSIRTEVKRSGETATGICYTNKAYAAYVEFGTGPKGQEKHAGISPNVSQAYSLSPWWIHESQINEGTAERLGWFYIDTEEGRFYRCSGQAAQPYMYPALHNNQEKVKQKIQESIRKQIARNSK